MKLNDKRFWILEILCLIPSIFPIYMILEENWDLFMVATFLFSGLVCGFYGYAYSKEALSKLFLKSWLCYNMVFVVAMSIICIFSDISLLGYVILYGVIIAIYTLIPFLIVVWLYKLIIRNMA